MHRRKLKPFGYQLIKSFYLGRLLINNFYLLAGYRVERLNKRGVSVSGVIDIRFEIQGTVKLTQLYLI